MFVAGELQVGTIGGGAMEADIAERGRQMLATSEAPDTIETETLVHRPDAGEAASGLICAGEQTMFYFVADPGHRALFARFADAVDEQRPIEIVIDAEGPRLEEADPQGPLKWDQEAVRYSEHAVLHHRVAIVGGGHCGRALSRVMHQLGYHVTIFETRPGLYTVVDNDWADEVRFVDDYAEAADLVVYPELTHFVVMTAALDQDVRGLVGAIGAPFPFVGVMGSSAKLDRIRTEVEAAGADPEWIGRWHAPVGLRMTSDTPEEIAISVAAEILRERPGLFPWGRRGKGS